MNYDLFCRFWLALCVGLILTAAHYSFGMEVRTVMHSSILAMAMGLFMGVAVQLDAVRQGHQA